MRSGVSWLNGTMKAGTPRVLLLLCFLYPSWPASNSATFMAISASLATAPSTLVWSDEFGHEASYLFVELKEARLAQLRESL